MLREDFVLCSFSKASQGLESIVGRESTVGMEEWLGLAPVGNGLNRPSLTGTLLVHSGREEHDLVLHNKTFIC